MLGSFSYDLLSRWKWDPVRIEVGCPTTLDILLRFPCWTFGRHIEGPHVGPFVKYRGRRVVIPPPPAEPRRPDLDVASRLGVHARDEQSFADDAVYNGVVLGGQGFVFVVSVAERPAPADARFAPRPRWELPSHDWPYVEESRHHWHARWPCEDMPSRAGYGAAGRAKACHPELDTGRTADKVEGAVDGAGAYGSDGW